MTKFATDPELYWRLGYLGAGDAPYVKHCLQAVLTVNDFLRVHLSYRIGGEKLLKTWLVKGQLLPGKAGDETHRSTRSLDFPSAMVEAILDSYHPSSPLQNALAAEELRSVSLSLKQEIEPYAEVFFAAPETEAFKFDAQRLLDFEYLIADAS